MADRIPWLPADGSRGVEHQRRDGTDCPYLAIIACNKCGWADTDEQRVAAAVARLDRMVHPDPMCECGHTLAEHPPQDKSRKRPCARNGPSGACGCPDFTPAAEVKAGER